MSRPHDLDQLLLDPHRLFAMALMVTDDIYRFRYLCDSSGAPPSVMARRIQTLRNAGYVETTRGAYQESWLRVTTLGRQRLQHHLTAFQQMLTTARTYGRSARRSHDAVQPKRIRQQTSETCVDGM